VGEHGEPSGREDEDDYDLLTFGEAGARLTQVIGEQRDLLERLRAAQASDAEIAVAEGRLADLQNAVERNSRRRIDPDTFRDFFGYDPAEK
jgi:hypothetical protein